METRKEIVVQYIIKGLTITMNKKENDGAGKVDNGTKIIVKLTNALNKEFREKAAERWGLNRGAIRQSVQQALSMWVVEELYQKYVEEYGQYGTKKRVVPLGVPMSQQIRVKEKRL